MLIESFQPWNIFVWNPDSTIGQVLNFMNILADELSTIIENIANIIGLKINEIKHDGVGNKNFTLQFVLDNGAMVRIHSNGFHFKADYIANGNIIDLDSVVMGVQYHQCCLLHSIDVVALILTLIKNNQRTNKNGIRREEVMRVYSNIDKRRYSTFMMREELNLRRSLNDIIRKVNVCEYYSNKFEKSKNLKYINRCIYYGELLNEKLKTFLGSLPLMNFFRQQEQQRKLELAKQAEEQKKLELARQAEAKRQMELEIARKAQEETRERRQKELEEKRREEEQKLIRQKQEEQEKLDKQKESKQKIEKNQLNEANNGIEPLNLKKFVIEGGDPELLAALTLSIDNPEDRAKYIDNLMTSAYNVVDNAFMDEFFEHIDNYNKEVKRNAKIQKSKQQEKQIELQKQKNSEFKMEKRQQELLKQKGLKEELYTLNEIQNVEFNHVEQIQNDTLRIPGTLGSETALKRSRKNIESALYI